MAVDWFYDIPDITEWSLFSLVKDSLTIFCLHAVTHHLFPSLSFFLKPFFPPCHFRDSAYWVVPPALVQGRKATCHRKSIKEFITLHDCKVLYKILYHLWSSKICNIRDWFPHYISTKERIRVLQAILRIKHVPIYRDNSFELIPLHTRVVTRYSLLLMSKTTPASVVFLVHRAQGRDHHLLRARFLSHCAAVPSLLCNV